MKKAKLLPESVKCPFSCILKPTEVYSGLYGDLKGHHRPPHRLLPPRCHPSCCKLTRHGTAEMRSSMTSIQNHGRTFPWPYASPALLQS